MSDTEKHTGKAGAEHGREHCRPSWCGEFPGEGHPLAATEDEKRMLAEGKDPYLVYSGAYANSDRVNARMGIYGGFTKETGLDAGIDRFETYQEPTVKPGDDPLARFVLSRIQEAEIEPRNEVLAVYDQSPAGPMAHRYAKHVRKDCVVFRQIVAAYLDSLLKAKDAEDSYGHDYWEDVGQGLRTAVVAIASRWSDHHEFLPEWSLG